MAAQTLINIGKDLQRVANGQKSMYNSNISEEFLADIEKEIADFNRARVETRTDEDRMPMYAAAQYLGISESTFRRRVKAGKLPAGRHTAGWKELSWSKAELDRLIGQTPH